MDNAIKLFEYKGNQVAFKTENGETYLNATQMAKAFDKKPYEYLRLPTTKELLEAMENKLNAKNFLNESEPITGFSGNSESQLVISKMGSPENGGGTWMHEDIAIDFAQWLSIDFRLWCNQRIKELMTKGVTSINLPDRKQLAQMVIEEVEKREEAEQKLAAMLPRSVYVEKVFGSDNTFTVNEIAQDLGLTAIKLNQKLNQLGIQYKQNGIWMLYARYRNKGFTKQVTLIKTGSVITHTVWTEKGRALIHKKLNPQMILALAVRDQKIKKEHSILN